MPTDLGRKIAALETMTVPQLVRKYADVFREPTNGRNKGWLVRRIARRMQANAHGGLTDATRADAADRANDADIDVGRIDAVIVYKVDRLSRSLLDFARMMASFDARKVSFVSVTRCGGPGSNIC